MNREEKLLTLTNKYFRHLYICEQTIKYLYNHTELFEQKYMCDFPEELFRFFSGKIGTYTKQRNKFLELLNTQQRKKLHEIEILEME